MQKTILSTADVARLFSVTETTVKRWADDGTLKCQKTPGGHRKFEIRNVIDFAEKNHFDPVGALALVDDSRFDQEIQAALLARDYGPLVREYVRRALSPKKTDLFAFLSYLYEHKIHLWEIHDHVLQPGMWEIGEMWTRGTIGINHEHHASYETLDALARLQSQILIKPPTGRSVICACLGDELHEIGLRATSYLFDAEGWTIHYLGARTPQAAVVAAARELTPDVVCLSITQPEPLPLLRHHIAEIAAGAHSVGGKVIAGGRGATNDIVGPDMCEAVLFSSRQLLDYITRFEKQSERTGNNGGQ